MANITRDDYINRMSQIRDQALAKGNPLTSTDISRGSGVLYGNPQPHSYISTILLPSITSGEVDANEIVGHIRDYTKWWTRVRRIRFEMTGTSSSNDYIKYGVPELWRADQSYTAPNFNAYPMNTIAKGNDISLDVLNQAIEYLKNIANQNIDKEITAVYCHSQAPSCHGSRGRR